jgi:hypothetical protein
MRVFVLEHFRKQASRAAAGRTRAASSILRTD